MKKGFTLAEVLITLAIIGVVAALTIPSVIINAREQGNITAFKKAVSVLNSAISLAVAVDTNGPSLSSSAGDLLNTLNGKMNVISTGVTQGNGGAYTCTEVEPDQGGFTDTEIASGSGNCATTTADGMQYMILDDAPNGVPAVIEVSPFCADTTTGARIELSADDCDDNDSTEWIEAGSDLTFGKSACTSGKPCLIGVDVNGAGKPNKMSSAATAASPAISGNVTDRFIIMVTEDGAVAATKFDKAVMAK